VNLHQALSHLFSECHVLWVDALCINQKDNKEKSWQVEQMRLVYQYAAKAMIWLGPASDDSDGAMNAISVIGNEAEALGIQSMKRSEMIKIWTDLAAGEASPFDGPVHKLLYNISARPNGCCTLPLSAMTALLSRPWWSRIWVRQELAVASEAIFACGQQRVPIGNFAAALWVFEAHSQFVYIKGLGNDSTLTQFEIQIAAWNDTRPQYMFDTRRRFLAIRSRSTYCSGRLTLLNCARWQLRIREIGSMLCLVSLKIQESLEFDLTILCRIQTCVEKLPWRC
jgi:hypothetical protein